MLSNECKFSFENACRFAQEHSLEVVYISGNKAGGNHSKCEKIFATIPQWLSLLDGAEYVITNSFHACVFSLIFEKRFAAVPLTGNFATMNTRLDTLFELFGIAPRYLASSSDFSAMEVPANWRMPQNLEFNLEQIIADS